MRQKDVQHMKFVLVAEWNLATMTGARDMPPSGTDGLKKDCYGSPRRPRPLLAGIQLCR